MPSFYISVSSQVIRGITVLFILILFTLPVKALEREKGNQYSTLLLPAAPPVLTTNANAFSYTEGNVATPLNLACALISAESAMESAKVEISDGFLPGDLLEVTPPAGVTATYDAASGVLTLTGKATKIEYESALNSLSFFSGSESPATNPSRRLSITVSDSYAISNAVNVSISIISVNDAPTFTKGPDVTVLENAGIQLVENWATSILSGPADEASQRISFVVNAANPDLFSSQPRIDASGRLSFTPAVNAFGLATITVRLKDDGGTANGGVDTSAPQTFIITILPVNNAPSFTRGANIEVLEDAGPQSLAAWATAIAPGPTNEASQQLAFHVTSDHKELFKTMPALDDRGRLTFTPAPDAFGMAMVAVSLKDDGGQANGGIDESLLQTFTITILPVNDAPWVETPSNLRLVLNSPAQTVMLTGLSPGPFEESQLLTITAVSDNPVLVTVTSLAYDPGASSASLLFQPIPQKTGMATITLQITDNGGRVNGGVDEYVTSFEVMVEEEELALFVPTLFSPNGDEHNGVFRIRGSRIASLQLRVFNQSGLEVFHTEDVSTGTQKGWDGTFKGGALPAGVYTWTLAGRFTDGRPLTFQGKTFGQVTLVR